jgi:threonine synthase
MGIPIAHFLAASNANDAMRRYLAAGQLPDGPSLETLSSAMDVARPSNLERILTIYERDLPALREQITPTRHEDAEVLDAMGRCFREHGYLMDPHTAVGLLGLEQYRKDQGPTPGLILSTADPAKFPETVVRATGQSPTRRDDWEGEGTTAEAIAAVKKGEDATVRLGPDPDALRALLRDAANTIA